jgi:hypothetical protein
MWAWPTLIDERKEGERGMRNQRGHNESWCSPCPLSSPWVPMHSTKGNSSWPPSQSSRYLEDLSGPSLAIALDSPVLQTPDQGASDPRPHDVGDNAHRGHCITFSASPDSSQLCPTLSWFRNLLQDIPHSVLQTVLFPLLPLS